MTRIPARGTFRPVYFSRRATILRYRIGVRGEAAMARNPSFEQFSRTIRIAWLAERTRITTGEAVERVAEARGKSEQRRSRREFLGDVARVVTSGALATAAGPRDRALAMPRDSRSIAIV